VSSVGAGVLGVSGIGCNLSARETELSRAMRQTEETVVPRRRQAEVYWDFFEVDTTKLMMVEDFMAGDKERMFIIGVYDTTVIKRKIMEILQKSRLRLSLKITS
jgi:hypothetical protein